MSGNPYADLIVPLPTGLQQIRLQRGEFEELVTPYLAETIVLLGRCVTESGLEASQLSGISLVGGSSRSPIVERMVVEAFPTVPVIRRGDPKTAVASGAARAVRSSVAAPPSVGRNTQEAAAGTAQQPVRLAPPISAPPAGAPMSGAGSQPPAAPLSQPPAPSVPPAVTPTIASGGGPISAPPMPPVSMGTTPTTPPPGTTSGAPPVQNLFGPTPEPAAKSKKPLVLIGAVLVALLVAAGVFVATRGGSKASAAQPTRQELTAALASVRQVRDAFGSDWNAEDISGDSDPFCPQFVLADPLRQGEVLFSTSGGSGASFTNTVFYENVSTFASKDDAAKFYEQDKAVTQNCETSTGNLGGTAVTYAISDASRGARTVGRTVNAIKYEASPTNGSGGVLLTGYIVETQVGRYVMTTQWSTYNRDPEAREIQKYYELTKTAFDKAAGAL